MSKSAIWFKRGLAMLFIGFCEVFLFYVLILVGQNFMSQVLAIICAIGLGGGVIAMIAGIVIVIICSIDKESDKPRL